MPVLRPIRRPRLPRARLGTRIIRPAPSAPPAGIQFVNLANAKNDTGAASLVVNTPAGVADGQLLLLLVCQNNATTTLDALTGWTDLPGVTWPLDSSTSRMYARYRFASSEPASYTLNWTGGTPKGIGTILAYSGVDGTTPFDVNPVGASESVSQATHTTGNLTTVTDQAWLVSFFADRAGTSGTWTPPSGDTERLDVTVTGTSQDSCEINDTNAGVTVGTYAKSATSTVATANATMLLIALRPAAGGGGTSFTQTVTDPIGITDAANQATTFAQTLTDPEGLLDSITQAATYQQTFTDPVGLLDAAVYDKSITASITDPIGLVDAASQVATFSQTAIDPEGLLDTATQAATFVQATIDPVGLTDAASQLASYAQTASDPEGIVDSTTQQFSGAGGQTFTDPVGITDAASQQTSFTQTLTDPVGLQDSAPRQLDRPITDPVGGLDAAAQSATVIQSATDPIGLLDAETEQVDRPLTDPIGLLDSQARLQAAAPTITDPVGSLDSTSQAIAAAQALTDPVGITDSRTQDATGPSAQTHTNPIGIVDTIAWAVVNVAPHWVEAAAGGAGLLEGSGSMSGLLEGTSGAAGVIEASAGI